jgi:hypothetical protein
MAPFEYGFTLGESPPRFRRGDANGDRSRDLSDAVRILLALFTGTAPLDCLDTGDTDDDGHLNITDPIFLLAHLFQGGGPPPAPGTDCGPDPTADALACEAPAGCG